MRFDQYWPGRRRTSKVQAFIRRQSIAVTCAIALAMSIALVTDDSAAAQVPSLPPVPGHVEGIGTYFAVTDGLGLNVRIDSSESVALTLDSLPRMTFFRIAPVSAATTTQLTIAGLESDTTYYKYGNGDPTPVVFTTDASGTYGYVQDIADRHLVRIQRAPSTWLISDDATGGDCTEIGAWDPSSKTCTLTQDVDEMVQIAGNGLTLDGAGHSITGGDSFGFGVFVSNVNGVTVKHAVVHDSSVGILADYSSNSRFTSNSLVRNTYGVQLFASGNSTLADNVVSDNAVIGIFLISQNGDSVTGNTVLNNGTYGIYLGGSGNNTVSGNTVSNHFWGINVWEQSNGNQVFNNNFLANSGHAVFDAEPNVDNVFSKAVPIGGNYYDVYDTPAEGCNDANQDLFCDAPFGFPYSQDDLAWALQNGWRVPEFVHYCAFGWGGHDAVRVESFGSTDCSLGGIGKVEIKRDGHAGGNIVSYQQEVTIDDKATVDGDILATKKVEIGQGARLWMAIIRR